MSERPLSLVVGRDKDVLPVLFGIHAPAAVDVLDCTFNKGVMWKNSGLAPSVTSDLDPSWGTDLVADFRNIPLPAASLDVIVFDPPHLPAAAASVNSSGIYRRKYGLDEHGDWRQGDNINPVFVEFLVEAKRLLRPDGLVFAKIADFVHNHRYQWQHVAFVAAVEAVGMTACDLIVKADPTSANLKSSKWQRVHHFRRAHTYWLVVRNSTKCEARPRVPFLLGDSG
jgi:hypothetical protein